MPRDGQIKVLPWAVKVKEALNMSLTHMLGLDLDPAMSISHTFLWPDYLYHTLKIVKLIFIIRAYLDNCIIYGANG